MQQDSKKSTQDLQFESNERKELSMKVSKRPRATVDFWETLTCKICFDFFTPPIVQCAKGHNLCKACADRLPTQITEFSQEAGVMEQVPRCPVCRSKVCFSTRNYVAEKQLSLTFVCCQWRKYGCNQKISLAERKEHELNCQFAPFVVCLYSEIEQEICNWRGPSEKLVDHLINVHKVAELTRVSLFRYLWNPPQEDYWRFRFRVLRATFCEDDLFQQANNQTQYVFLLEHFYDPSRKMLLFMVRTVIKELKKIYKISILNRNESNNRISFQDTTSFIGELPQIQKYMEMDKKRIMQIPLELLNAYSYYSEEDQSSYFSIHVEFIEEGEQFSQVPVFSQTQFNGQNSINM